MIRINKCEGSENMKRRTNFRDKRKLFVFLLAYTLFVTSYFSLHTFSKFVSVANSKTGTKDVAKWDVSLDTSSQANSIDLISGNTSNAQDYVLTVSSDSEVAVDCSLKITNLPSDLTLKIDGGTDIPVSNNQISVNNFCSFNANDSTNTKSFILTFIAPLNASVVSNRTININVTCKQRSI